MAEKLAARLGNDVLHSSLAAISASFAVNSEAYRTILRGDEYPVIDSFDVAEQRMTDPTLEEIIQRGELKYFVLLNHHPRGILGTGGS